MIRFKKLLVKNFMSYGNVPTTIELDKHKSTLLQGENGAGKSGAVLDGISFALYGKAFRKINLGQLINSINQRDCRVEIDFTVGSDSYKVVRCLKPNKLEIYRNDQLIDQEAAVRDYQGYLEKNILKISHKTFTQVFVLGSASFTPFMQLPTGLRREVIEDVLDIGVFTRMNRLLRERMSSVKEELSLVEVKIESAKTETINQKKLIEFMTSSRDVRITEIATEKKSYEEELTQLEKRREQMTDRLREILLSEPNDVASDMIKNSEAISDVKRYLRDIDANQKRITHLKNCPTCSQDVSDDHKNLVTDELSARRKTLSVELDVLTEEKERLSLLSEERTAWDCERREVFVELTTVERDIESKKNQVDRCDEKLREITSSAQGDLDTEKEKLRSVAASVVSLIGRKNELIKERSTQEVCVSLLKDSGIKASIVKEYLPILNKLINKFLSEFEFFVNFELDENFSETIKSRGRDDFSYMSFSEGEKKRIDVAILLAFRQIASMKNSAKINLLISDEVDGGLDGTALEKFVELITTGIDANAWVISHVLSNTELVNRFDAQAYVKKVGDFSVMEIE